MNVKLLKNLFVALVAAISISSCSSANDCAMASDEGVAKIKELIKAHVDINECKIYRIEWKEDWKERKLENVLSQISVANPRIGPVPKLYRMIPVMIEVKLESKMAENALE